jgi:hypothetical protein
MRHSLFLLRLLSAACLLALLASCTAPATPGPGNPAPNPGATWQVLPGPTRAPQQPGDGGNGGMRLITSTPGGSSPVQPPAPPNDGTTVEPPPVNPPAPQLPRVAWDTSHGPREGQDGAYTVSDIYHDLAQALVEDAITLLDDAQALPSCTLSGYDALVLAATSVYSSGLSQGEVDCLRQFVQDGHGLVILGEAPGFTNYLRGAADAFGAQVNLAPEQWSVPCEGGSLCTGVGTLEFYQGGSVSAGNAATVAQSGGSAAALTIESYGGRVVIIGDSNLFDDRWLGNNLGFAHNVFRWVTKLTP